MSQSLRLLGLTAPFAYAGLVYALFWFMERHSSPAARRSMSAWLKGEPYGPEHVSNLALYAFDRVYSYPLVSYRALARTALISVILTLTVVYTVYPFRVSFTSATR